MHATNTSRILIVDYDPQWPKLFRHEAERIRAVLGARVLQIEHTGSTSVPSLAAKPIIDMLLAVTDSADEDMYVPELNGVGYEVHIREVNWHEHRMLTRPEPEVNLHVFTSNCQEIDRILVFRDWLRKNAADRGLYARTKLALAQREWEDVQDYADAKAPGHRGDSRAGPDQSKQTMTTDSARAIARVSLPLTENGLLGGNFRSQVSRKLIPVS